VADFPAYAKLRMDGLQRVRPAGAIRTPMEGGLAKQRKFPSKVLPTLQAIYTFDSKADYNSFLTWYETDVNRVGWFNWTDPVDNVVREARIVGGALRYEKPLRRTLDMWDIAFTLEWL